MSYYSAADRISHVSLAFDFFNYYRYFFFKSRASVLFDGQFFINVSYSFKTFFKYKIFSDTLMYCEAVRHKLNMRSYVLRKYPHRVVAKQSGKNISHRYQIHIFKRT